MRRALLLSAFVLVAAGCREAARDGMAKGQIKDLWTQVSDKEFIRVRGVGSVPDGIREQTRRRGLARNAALVAARYELLQVIKGIKVTGGLSVGQLIQSSGEIREVADRVVAGAEEVQTEWGKDDGAVVLLELRRDKVEDILSKTADSDLSVKAAMPGLADGR